MLLQDKFGNQSWKPEPQKAKGLMYFQTIAGPEPSSQPVEALVTNTNHHTGEDHFPGYE
jgi:hypothetical protein